MSPAPLVIITDLDGSLLDQQSYSYQASLPAIRKVQALKIPLVLCSSKTRSESEALWKELRLHDPFIVENGGAVYFRRDYFPFSVENTALEGGLQKLVLGESVEVLRAALFNGARQLRVHVRCFGDMTLEEISDLTGLPRDWARAAAEREYDEPFIVERGNSERLFTALRTKGYKITQGDRFFHLTGGSDKGKAASALLQLYRRSHPSIVSAGLGNSPNDLPFLLQVNHPILIRNPDGSWDSTVLQNVSRLRRTFKIGPEGWTEAVEELLREIP